ncbi:hypothetical protein [Kordiimonas sp.]|uniref:hypothetical protein n=1 Tax=Kordiimonas sp. TaxID=1970157 RepID=UPI003B51743E
MFGSQAMDYLQAQNQTPVASGGVNNTPSTAGEAEGSDGWGIGGFFKDLLGAGTQIGMGWLQTEAYKDVLKDQVQIQTLQQQLNNSQNNAASNQSGGGATAGAMANFDWKPWAIGGATLFAGLLVLKMVK